MTLAIDVSAQLKALADRIGYQEGPNNANEFTVWQTDGKWTAAEWCDSLAQFLAVAGGGFVGWADARVHCQWGMKGDAYCPYTVVHAKALGLWRDAGSGYVPGPGDQELMSWNHNGVADHIGTVAVRKADGSRILGEGNHNNKLEYVVRDDKFTLGWVALSTLSKPSTTTTPEDDMSAEAEKQIKELHELFLEPGHSGVGQMTGANVLAEIWNRTKGSEEREGAEAVVLKAIQDMQASGGSTPAGQPPSAHDYAEAVISALHAHTSP